MIKALGEYPKAFAIIDNHAWLMRMKNMIDKIKSYIKENQMITPGDKFILGLSGGPDSVCLFYIMEALKKELSCTIVCVHVNHLLRGKEADGDEFFVKKLCKAHGVPIEIERIDVKTYAKEHLLSEEEAGRMARRQAFNKAGKKHKANKVLLAHHGDDNAETLLLNLCRGCMEQGLEGMRPVKGIYIRPLLAVRKEEILHYLRENDISYCIDQTNENDTYARNRLRNHVLGYLESEINDEAVSHMNETMNRMGEINAYLKEQTKQYIGMTTTTVPRGVLVKEEAFKAVPSVFSSSVFYEVLVRVCGREKDITKRHISSLLELMQGQTGKALSLPYGVYAYKEYEGVTLQVGRKEATQEREYKVTQRIFAKEGETISFPRSIYTKWFDYDIISHAVEIRHRRSGDYITINQMGGRKKLKQFLIDEKVKREERDSLWLVCDGDHVMWVVGMRQNPCYQISDSTKNILEINFCGGF